MNDLTRHKLQTWKHKFWVMWYMFYACCALMKRAWLHDKSKLEYIKGKPGIEVEKFAKSLSKLRNATYNSVEYWESMEELKPAIDSHYKKNKHHPEHWMRGIDGMGPIDKIEMLCDWKSASKRHADGSMEESLRQNVKRFKYGSGMELQLRQAAEEIGLVKAEEEE